ncbi:MAG: DUF1800 family protein [Planctomycetes bacterium]|nr:DUF1800 family protein [Planctomycetota bacterium]
MNRRWVSVVFLGGLVWASSALGSRLSAQDPNPVEAVKAATAALAEADKVVVAARNALQAARDNLDTNRFNSAAYNNRVTTDQVNGAKDKYEKAEPAAKEDALEVYELAQELAAQRKVEFDAAQQVLPQREAEAKAAEEKYTAALTAAEGSAAQIKALVRQSEADRATKIRDAKQAIEKAAFSKATSDQQSAANAAVSKAFADLAAADAVVQGAAAALKQATDADRAQKTTDAENAAKAYAAALHAVGRLLPEYRSDPAKALALELRVPLIEAEKVVQTATAALQQVQADLAQKVEAVKQAEARIKAAQEGVEKRIAKTRAAKDLTRETEAGKKAEAARALAEQAVPPKAADLERAQQAYAATLKAAVQALVVAPEAQVSLAADKAAIAKAAADREAAMKAQNEQLAAAAAEAQAAADKAQAELAAVEGALANQVAVREGIDRMMQQRFYREARSANDELRANEAALNAANQALQPKIAAFNKTTADLKAATDALAKAQADHAAAATVVTTATKDKEAADKAVADATAAKTAADQAAKDAAAAVTAAQEAVGKAGTAEEKAAAEKAVADTTAASTAAAEKAKAADDGLKAAQAALEKTVAALTAAQTKAAELAKVVADTEPKVAPAQQALAAATAEKDAAEKAVGEKRQAVDSGPPKIAAARFAAYGGLKPLDPAAWDMAKARHLMVRAGFGGTQEEVAKLHAMGLHGAVRHMVHFKDLPAADVAFVAYPKNRPENYHPALSGEEQQRINNERVAADQRQIQAMKAWWVRRMIESPRPLEEKLTLFWHGQIPSQYSDVGDSYYMYLQNQLFRDNAAGNFDTLLHGIAHDAAMLKYLNNDTNVKGKANENLAREIMELFSMGRDQGYGEPDIRQGARALTGFTYDPWTGQFRFVTDNHDTEPKTVLGKSGNFSGDDFVRIILETPAPPKFIARQMFSFFAHASPSIDTVESLASVIKLNNYELTPMLENLFLSEEFYSEQSMRTEIKSPVQMIVGLHRDLGLKTADYPYLVSALREMGQDVFEPPSVFGWQGGRTWITTSRVLNRYNVLAETLQQRPRAGQTGIDVVGTVLAGKTFQNHGEVVDYLVHSLWSVPLADAKRAALVEFLKPLPEPAQWGTDPAKANAILTRLLVMIACSPEFQLT